MQGPGKGVRPASRAEKTPTRDRPQVVCNRRKLDAGDPFRGSGVKANWDAARAYKEKADAMQEGMLRNAKLPGALGCIAACTCPCCPACSLFSEYSFKSLWKSHVFPHTGQPGVVCGASSCGELACQQTCSIHNVLSISPCMEPPRASQRCSAAASKLCSKACAS